MNIRGGWMVLLPVVALVALTAWQVAAGDGPGCDPDQSTLPVGGRLDLTIDEPTWISVASRYGDVYRMDVAGTEGTALELWRVWFDSVSQCGTPAEQVAELEIVGGADSLTWTAGSESEFLMAKPPAAGVEAQLRLGLAEVAQAPSFDNRYVPWVTKGRDDSGTSWVTELALASRLGVPSSFDLVLHPADGSEPRQLTIETGSYGTVVVSDVVEAMAPGEELSGWLAIEDAAHRAAVSVRIVTDGPSPRVGQRIVTADHNWALGGGPGSSFETTASLLVLGTGQDDRVDVGLSEIVGEPVAVELVVWSGRGERLADTEVQVPASGQVMIVDLLTELDVPAGHEPWIEARVAGSGRALVFSSIVDERSGDAVFLPASRATDRAGTLFIPTAAHTVGAGGTRWRTDLRIRVVGGGSNVRLTYTTGNPATTRVGVVTVPDGEVKTLEDVVGWLGGRGVGGITLHAERERSGVQLEATSRTYVEDEGAFGQLVPARREPDVRSSGSLVGLPRTGEHRTDFGVFNPSWFDWWDVVARLTAADGRLLGSAHVAVAPRGHARVDGIFAQLGVPRTDGWRLDWEAFGRGPGPSASRRVLAYLSMVNTESGDPTYVDAEPWISGSALPSRFELDHRRDALRLDRLAETVSLKLPPGGPYALAVSGGGDLGRPDLPLRALCMLLDAERRVQARVVEAGDVVEPIAGDSPIRCVVPDWLTLSDNRGALVLTVPGTNLTATLDAQANAIALNRLGPPVVAQWHWAETIEIVSSGDLGRWTWRPQTLVMWRDPGSTALHVEVAHDGDVIGPVATDFQVAVAALEWTRLDDNSGITTVETACTRRALTCGGTANGVVDWRDCSDDRYAVQEVIELGGVAGRTVTLRLSADDFASLTVRSPSGEVLAEAFADSYSGHTVQIEDLQLPDAGPSTASVSISPRADVAYQLSLDCELR